MVGVVLNVEPVSKSGLQAVTLNVGGESSIVVVTAATNIAERTIGKQVAVALVGTEIGGEAITKRSVGGVVSEGMLLDSPTLGWTGGAANVAVLIPDSIAPGQRPPASRPRSNGDAETTPAPGPVENAMFEKKQSKEERKAAAKAAREAKKLKKKKGGAAEEEEDAQDPDEAPTQVPQTEAAAPAPVAEASGGGEEAAAPPTPPTEPAPEVSLPPPPEPSADPAEPSTKAPTEASSEVPEVTEATDAGGQAQEQPKSSVASVFGKKNKKKGAKKL